MKPMTEREFIGIVSSYHKRLLYFVNKQIHDVSIAEELVQDILMEFAEDVRQRKNVISVNAYLYGIARHKVADYLRKKRLKQILLSALPEPLINSCATMLFSETVSQHEIQDKVKRILAKLPHDYAVIIRLKYIEGLPVKQIASSLSLSFKTVESMLFRARKTFSKLYKSV